MILPLLVFALGVSAAPQWHKDLPSALAEAKASGKPVLIDFQASWCYSCYYMEKHVLESTAFAKSAERVVLEKVDTDKEDGHALKEKYKVNLLPTYLLLSPKGEPLGRIRGEQTESDFLNQLEALLSQAPGDPLAQSIARLRENLATNEYKRAVKDISRIPKPTLAALETRADWKILTARLTLKRNIAAKDPKWLETLKTTLALEDSCESADDVSDAEDMVAALKESERKAVLALERAALEKLAQARLFVPAAERCSDFRAGIYELADVDDKLGDKEGRRQLLEKTVAFLDQQGIVPGDDRSFDDNRRFFLELLGDDKRVSEFYDVLTGAYPSDFVYPLLRASWLLDRKRPSEALPFVEKADLLCYGSNRLWVTEVHALILADLGRKGEAKELLRRDAKAARKSFPARAADLEKRAAKL